MNKTKSKDLIYYKEVMTKLGARASSISQMEKEIGSGNTNFEIRETHNTTDGAVIVHLPFYQGFVDTIFTELKVSHFKFKPLKEGQLCFIVKSPENEIHISKPNEPKVFTHLLDAIEQFKKSEGNAELTVGNDLKNKTSLATMKDGKVIFIAKEYQNAFHFKPNEQEFYIQQGEGFSISQAINLIQGRSVYRNLYTDLDCNSSAGWINLEMENGKQGFRNYKIRSYQEPNYGYDLSKILDRFNIKGMNNNDEKDKLMTSLKNGDRPTKIVTSNGNKYHLEIETSLPKKSINFFTTDGKRRASEQFLTSSPKSQLQDLKNIQSKSPSKEQELLGIGLTPD